MVALGRGECGLSEMDNAWQVRVQHLIFACEMATYLFGGKVISAVFCNDSCQELL